MKTELRSYLGESSKTRSKPTTATESSAMKWFGVPEPIQDHELDLDLLLAEFKDDPEFQAIQAETFASLGNTLLKDCTSLDALRLRAGLSQQQVADKVGSTQPYIARLEKGKVTDPGVKLVSKLAKALNVNVEEIVHIFEK